MAKPNSRALSGKFQVFGPLGRGNCFIKLIHRILFLKMIASLSRQFTKERFCILSDTLLCYHKRQSCHDLYNPEKLKQHVPDANLVCAEETELEKSHTAKLLTLFRCLNQSNIFGHMKMVIFIGQMCNQGLIYGFQCLSVSESCFADFHDVTLAYEDTNSILTDDANKTFQGNVAMKVTTKFATNATDIFSVFFLKRPLKQSINYFCQEKKQKKVIFHFSGRHTYKLN